MNLILDRVNNNQLIAVLMQKLGTCSIVIIKDQYVTIDILWKRRNLQQVFANNKFWFNLILKRVEIISISDHQPGQIVQWIFTYNFDLGKGSKKKKIVDYSTKGGGAHWALEHRYVTLWPT